MTRKSSAADRHRSNHGNPELYRQLVEAVRDYAIFALDPEGYILTWNPGAERFKGYSADEIVGKHFSIFYPPDAIARKHPQAELDIAKRDGRFEEEGWRLRKDGSRFWANVVITALRDEDGELIGFGKVTRDLTERLAAQERAIDDTRRLAEAEAANRAKSDFLASMSHELRTPLNAISGYVELLESGLRGPINETQAEDLRRIRRSGKHLLSIINDLLNFSRLEAGTVHYDIKPFPVGEAIEEVRAMTEPIAMTKRLDIAWPPASNVQVRADMSKVEQILVNLITNAIKFTAEGGSVTISCDADDESVRIHVADTGVGIPEGSLMSIFEPFVQVGRTLTSAHEGAGLGLSISHDLARAMGGELSAESAEGEGSTFTLHLPKA